MDNMIIITGANNGIGLECVKQFCTEYPSYIIVAISNNLNNLQQLGYSNLQIHSCDVTDYQHLKAVIDDFTQIHKINCLINCAGTSYNGDFCDIETTKIQRMIDVNIRGLTNTIELILPNMRLHKAGTIINISSLADRYPRPMSAVYGASKAYVKSLSDSLRVSEAKYNLRICNISPAIIDTPLLASVGKNQGQVIAVFDFVNIIKFIYQQPQSVCVRDMVVAPTSYEG